MADNDPATNQDGGAGSPDPKGASEGNLSDEHLGAIVTRVREDFGLKDGQRLDQMVTGASKSAVRDAFGLEKGQNAMEVIGSFVADQIKAGQAPPPKPEPNADLKADLDAVKKTTRELMEAKEVAEASAYKERRRSMIRDSLDSFDIDPNLKGLVTRGFVEGVEANLEIGDDGLIVKDTEGTPQPFGSYLKDYFIQNKSFLAQQKFNGSGARPGSGSPGDAGLAEQLKGKSGRELGEAYAQAAKDDPEGALAAVTQRNKEAAARLFG